MTIIIFLIGIVVSFAVLAMVYNMITSAMADAVDLFEGLLPLILVAGVVYLIAKYGKANVAGRFANTTLNKKNERSKGGFNDG